MAKGDKYIELTNYLKCKCDKEIELSFVEVENIVGFKLPPSARIHYEWWSNTESHSQAFGWLNAGYLTVDISETFKQERIRFLKRVTS